MSARNSVPERRCSSVLPFLAPLPAPRVHPSASIRRDVFPSSAVYDRSLTPFYDFYSESDTGPGTPDFRSEESDSSTGSVLARATAEATRALADEWERVERTLYGEPGEQVTRPQLLEECRQWREMIPHLRVIGKRIPLPTRSISYQDTAEEEVIAMHYSDREEFSESEERLSESSSDTTPCNSPRPTPITIPTAEPKLNREKSAFARTHYIDNGFNDSFYSMLQITPLYPRSPPRASAVGKRHYSSILKSEMSSSKWMRNNTPESPPRLKCDRNSAKSFISLDTRNCGPIALSATERKKTYNGTRVYTAKQRDNTRLQPLFNCKSILPDGSRKQGNVNQRFTNGKVSLPPLHLEEENLKSKGVNSARKSTWKRTRRSAAPRGINLISETKNF